MESNPTAVGAAAAAAGADAADAAALVVRQKIAINSQSSVQELQSGSPIIARIECGTANFTHRIPAAAAAAPAPAAAGAPGKGFTWWSGTRSMIYCSTPPPPPPAAPAAFTHAREALKCDQLSQRATTLRQNAPVAPSK